MPQKKSYITVTDQFCGAGGSSQGVRNFGNRMGGGIEVAMALNHWKLAIETHNTNFPDTYHDCTDISACDPRRYMSTDILITSPECTNHSLAKGKKKATNQMELFAAGLMDPAAERSRATMWDVPRFTEYHNYNIIIVENVVDARSWIMWEAWLSAMFLLGYNHKCVYLNSMHAHPTPQSRDRMYIVFWKKGNKAPDLEYRPKAFCSCCDKEVDSIQSWRNSRRQFGKYRQQYDYRCPRCAALVEPYYYAAFNVIDWSIPGQRIGDRKKDLAPNTRARIQYGLKKHGNSDFVIYLDHSKAGHLTSDIKSPINTQTTSQVSAIVSPFMLKVDRSIKDYKVTDPNPTVVGGGLHHGIVGIPAMMTKGGYSGGASPISASEPTITTQHNYGVVAIPAMIDGLNRTGKARPISEPAGTALAGGNHHGVLGIPTQPFIVEHFGQSSVRDIKSPLGAVMTKDKYGILAPPMIITNKGQSMAMDITKPLSTQTQCINHGILSTESVNAFLSYYYGTAQVSGMPTVDPFSDMTVFHFLKHGFQYMGRITIETDVVRENNQTYRLGWTEKTKDGTKMGVGCPEYLLLFRKLPSDTSKAYADVPVVKTKQGYNRGQWQIDARAKWNSSGERFLSPDELRQHPIERINKYFGEWAKNSTYNYDNHTGIAIEMDKLGKLPATFETLRIPARTPWVWDDVNRMITLNSKQTQKKLQNHVCPLQFDIVDRVIENWSNAGELVYDPFGGIMTVPYRAIKLGRKGKACELNPDYFRDGLSYLRAIEQEVQTPTLFQVEEIEVSAAV
ncbi:MAG: DNA cytosine methyltransferase [Chlorobium sp.]|jgi:DNA (cytosine-5)-methyltransferase 1|nr:DNA cytosine methyltransferase [Chlorobium sp.]